MTKPELREKYKAIRLAMASDDIEAYSLKICRGIFLEVDWNKVKKICAYAAIPRLKEVDINPLLEAVKYKFPDTDITLLGRSKKQKLPTAKFDLILVPCLAFDKDNYRLGWGGGFYDRFLAGQPQAYKVGACFHNGYLDGKLPRQAYDIPLDTVVTEKTAVLPSGAAPAESTAALY
ncbi:MAG TPA: 5-formyltetrahydrofolate cyclo-ligase [Candidatus Saccharimonadales bacterium]|nr:5-formyltetrahydrofolate cyclo-ligase [Candidatus Saccharimonadales bacterium]